MLGRLVVPAAEFDLPAGHLDAPALPAVRFPDMGRPEADVLDDVRGRFDEDRFEPDRNFSITYSGIPSAISQRVEELARGRFFVEWARETELGTWSMEREAVAMMASLLGGDAGAGGFITTGGTESNLAAMRLARNLGHKAEPEIIAPVTMHFSFRLGAELMGIRLVEIEVDDDTYLPRIEDIERAITPRTVGLVCSAPGGSFGVLDPVEAFADLMGPEVFRAMLTAMERDQFNEKHSNKLREFIINDQDARRFVAVLARCGCHERESIPFKPPVSTPFSNVEYSRQRSIGYKKNSGFVSF
jgi:hypothetical protein